MASHDVLFVAPPFMVYALTAPAPAAASQCPTYANPPSIDGPMFSDAQAPGREAATVMVTFSVSDGEARDQGHT